MSKEIVVPLILFTYTSSSRGRKTTDLVLIGPKNTTFEGYYNVIAYNPWGKLDKVPKWLGRWTYPSYKEYFHKLIPVSDITTELLLWVSAPFLSDIYKELLSTGSALQIRDEVHYIFR